MNLYLAPMEEVTGYVFRNTVSDCFGGVDKYFTPFISPNQNKILKTREGRELIPEHNAGKNVVPQVLTNDADQLFGLIDVIYELGYREVNLNFGCPSNTVVKKNRGSGILRDPDYMDRFLNNVFESIEKYNGLKISVKTRIGVTDKEDTEDIVRIYNRYPICELIVHPRLQKDFYNGEPDMETFSYYYESMKMPVCYNGNIFNAEDYTKVVNEYPNICAVMIGRGGVMHPSLFREIKGGESASVDELKKYHRSLFDEYCREFGENDAVCKMKEFWTYFKVNFPDKSVKDIMKTKTAIQYKSYVTMMFT